MNLKATSFATRQDLAAFCHAIMQGKTWQQADEVGDNGVGGWGDPTWKLDSVPPIVAMPKPAAHNSLWNVTLNGKTVECICQDRSPAGVVDLSPSALRAFGLDADTELLSTAFVEEILPVEPAPILKRAPEGS